MMLRNENFISFFILNFSKMKNANTIMHWHEMPIFSSKNRLIFASNIEGAIVRIKNPEQQQKELEQQKERVAKNTQLKTSAERTVEAVGAKNTITDLRNKKEPLTELDRAIHVEAVKKLSPVEFQQWLKELSSPVVTAEKITVKNNLFAYGSRRTEIEKTLDPSKANADYNLQKDLGRTFPSSGNTFSNNKVNTGGININ